MNAVAAPLHLVGCGILHKEVNYLIGQNGWNLVPLFLDSALHNYYDRLQGQLTHSLDDAEQQARQTVVFYGACHPKMADMLEEHHTVRTLGQNCIVMLLGYERFMEELRKGAYFLLEDWALSWEPMLTEAFGRNQSVVREIFHSSHQYLLAVRTPCSDDFTLAAESAARFVDLPLVWMDADLKHLEWVLTEALDRKRRTLQ
ncbi:MAG: DUF1638 domain-containing protein [Magnetococcales bacterium]|nr:DUF1638 domain-containing protein [Magnetococcales bacterium]